MERSSTARTRSFPDHRTWASSPPAFLQHAREAAPEASVLKLGMTYPLPMETMRQFAQGVERCLVVEEGDPFLVEVPARRASRWKASRRCTASANST